MVVGAALTPLHPLNTSYCPAQPHAMEKAVSGYEVCQKSFKTGVTQDIFQTQTISLPRQCEPDNQPARLQRNPAVFGFIR